MIDVKNLTPDQLIALITMKHFNCSHINCDDCPLFSEERDCGSVIAGDIIDRYEKETNQ